MILLYLNTIMRIEASRPMSCCSVEVIMYISSRYIHRGDLPKTMLTLEEKWLGITHISKNNPNNVLAMIDMRLPNMKTLKDRLGKNRKCTLHRRSERTTPANGVNHIPD